MFYNRNRHVGLSVCHDREESGEYKRFTMHTHTTAELFCFVAGRAIYHIEGSSYRLQPGDILLMRPSEAHYVEQDPDSPYERICLNFDPGILGELDPENRLLRPYFDREPGKRNLYRPSAGEQAQLREYLDQILKTGDRLKAIANLILLLRQIDSMFERDNNGVTEPDTLEYRIVRYINENLSGELTLAELCDRFFISRAQLCRRFKKITGTSVGKYISAKRLILARDLLLRGQKPMEVYALCGYQDYSTFYRAYIAYFGCSPKELQAPANEGNDRLEIP